MKTFVLDTNVLLHDPEALNNFPRSQIVLPVTVLEELDKMKRLPNELGKNARAIFRFLDSLQQIGSGNLSSGVTLNNQSTIRIKLDSEVSFSQLATNVNDNKIIMAAYELHEKGERVVFVSKDLAARIKAETIGLTVEDYENLKFSYESIYHGVRRLELPKYDIDLFYKDGFTAIPDLHDWHPNEYCILTAPENTSAIAKYNSKTQRLESLLPVRALWGIKPRNVEQRIAVDLLLRDDIKLVTLMGQAGTGKTLLALACAMHKVFDEGIYNRILVSRPIVPLGRDIGYLPGTKEEKLTPWMQPIRDNLEFLCESTGHGPNDTLHWVLSSEKIEMEAVTYIRGRSLPKMFIIVDEAQNLTPHEIKTIITRAGEGTKVVLTGDLTQIDNPYLDENSNGLTYTISKCKNYALCGHISLEKTERSELAALAAEVL